MLSARCQISQHCQFVNRFGSNLLRDSVQSISYYVHRTVRLRRIPLGSRCSASSIYKFHSRVKARLPLCRVSFQSSRTTADDCRGRNNTKIEGIKAEAAFLPEISSLVLIEKFPFSLSSPFTKKCETKAGGTGDF